MIDLAIIGGGPAGTAAALEARRAGLEVGLWEGGGFPRHKVCGEFISPEAVPLLEREIPAALEGAAVIRRAEFIPRRGPVCAFRLPSPARGLSRWALDLALWQAAKAQGVRALERTPVRRVSWAPTPGGAGAWALAGRSGPAEPARALVVACGRWWAVDGLPSPAHDQDRAGGWMGAKAHFHGLPRRDAVEMYFFPGGYCGLAPIEDGRYNACCLVHRELARAEKAGGVRDFAAWMTRIARHPALSERFRGAAQTSRSFATAPVRMGRRKPARGGALFAGDAAGFLDPFTGDGIAQALYGGRLAARVAARMLKAGNAGTEPLIEAYGAGRERAVRRSYRLAALMRWLVRAPAAAQAAAFAVLPWLGGRLLAQTRWRAEGDQPGRRSVHSEEVA